MTTIDYPSKIYKGYTFKSYNGQSIVITKGTSKKAEYETLSIKEAKQWVNSQ